MMKRLSERVKKIAEFHCVLPFEWIGLLVELSDVGPNSAAGKGLSSSQWMEWGKYDLPPLYSSKMRPSEI